MMRTCEASPLENAVGVLPLGGVGLRGARYVDALPVGRCSFGEAETANATRTSFSGAETRYVISFGDQAISKGDQA